MINVDLLGCPRAEFLEVFGLPNQISTARGQLANCGFVGLLDGIDLGADLLHILNKTVEFVVQQPCPFRNFDGVFIAFFDGPQIFDSF